MQTSYILTQNESTAKDVMNMSVSGYLGHWIQYPSSCVLLQGVTTQKSLPITLKSSEQSLAASTCNKILEQTSHISNSHLVVEVTYSAGEIHERNHG